MSFEKLIKKNFNFLKKIGYKRKCYSKNGDYEIHYINNNNAIEINYYLCANERNNSDEYLVCIIIKSNNVRNELFTSTLFKYDNLMQLRRQLKQCESNEQKLIKYAEFLKINAHML